MSALTYLFIATLAVGLVVELWLGQRQRACARAHRATVPAAFRDRIGLAEHQKAADYAVARARLGQVAAAVNGLVLLGWSVGGGFDLMDRAWRGLDAGPLADGVGVVVGIVAATWASRLPLSWYQRFVIDRRFGFNRATFGLYLADTLKKGLLGLAVLVPLVGAVLWLMNTAGALWWLYAWALWTAFEIARLWVAPQIIAPLFNRFTPLTDAALSARIERLARRCGFALKAIRVMDASKRSAHGNAYFAGFGAAKRVVLFDTLLQTLGASEVEAVLAHELGHFKGRHLHKYLASQALARLAGLALLAWLAPQAWFYAALGVATPSPHAALVLFAILIGAGRVVSRPIEAFLLRRLEYQADAFAARHGDAEALADALISLHGQNATTLTPDPLYAAFHHGHPTLPSRLARIAGQPLSIRI